MPELPEVETIRRGLEPRITGLTLQSLDILEPKTAHFAPKDFEEHILNRKVTRIRRRAKVLIWDFDSGYSLLFHLKMTGQIVLVTTNGDRFAGGHPTASMADDLPDNSTRLTFNFGDINVFMNDQRKFGWVKLVDTAEAEKEAFLSRVGPEPLSNDFSFDYFFHAVKKRNAPIKAVLLDQTVAAGIGNIYADEALHLAKIHPVRVAAKLTFQQLNRLYEAIKIVIEESIKRGGTSFTHYVNVLGTRGDYLEYARAFRRTGLPCPVCATPIQKIRVAGRGTHICPECQRAPRGWKA